MLRQIKDLFNRESSIRYFLSLFLLAIGVMAFFSVLGCTCGGTGSEPTYSYSTTSSDMVDKKPGAPTNPASGSMRARSIYYNKGDSRTVYLTGSSESDLRVNMTYTPPNGATSVSFPGGPTPEPGGPPYVFKNVSESQEFSVTYNLPQQTTDSSFIDTLTVSDSNGSSTSTLSQKYGYFINQTSPMDESGESVTAAPDILAAEAIEPWTVQHFVDFDDELNQDVCEDILTYGQSDDAFYLWRVPVPPHPVVGEYGFSITLPVYNESGGINPKALEATILASGYELDLPLEVRHDATVWANTHLVKPADETWVALGVKQDAVLDCGIVPVREYWSIMLTSHFDLSSEPDDCEECSLPSYGCYHSEPSGSAPLARAAFEAILKQEMDENAVMSSDDTTCIAINPILLNTGATWFYEPFTATLDLDPGDEILVHYWIENHALEAKTFDLALTSDLAGASWSIHPESASDPWAPDLFSTITDGKLTVPASSTKHFFMSSVVPVDASGTRSVSVTASSAGMDPESWAHTTQLIISPLPPIKEPVILSVRCYLPLVMR